MYQKKNQNQVNILCEITVGVRKPTDLAHKATAPGTSSLVVGMYPFGLFIFGDGSATLAHSRLESKSVSQPNSEHESKDFCVLK